MRDALLVALGGASGSVLRWALSSWIARLHEPSRFPWGTLAVNLLGSFAIGALLTLAFERGALPTPFRLLLVTGVLGGFTTFSAFSLDAVEESSPLRHLLRPLSTEGDLCGHFHAAVFPYRLFKKGTIQRN